MGRGVGGWGGEGKGGQEENLPEPLVGEEVGEGGDARGQEGRVPDAGSGCECSR